MLPGISCHECPWDSPPFAEGDAHQCVWCGFWFCGSCASYCAECGDQHYYCERHIAAHGSFHASNCVNAGLGGAPVGKVKKEKPGKAAT